MRSVLRRNVVGIVLMMVMALLPCALAARADEIHVPDDFPTIQEGVDAAVDGDEVIIADGVYSGDGNHSINFLGKLITVRSENGPDNCIVDLQGLEKRGFMFVNGETNATVLDGLTVRNAHHKTFQHDVLRGGAIAIADASPAISNCIFSDNDLEGKKFQSFGGAIYSSGDPLLTNCVFDTNSAYGDDIAGGGAFYNDGGDPQFFDCHFQNNSSTAWPGLPGVAFGGAIGAVGSVTLTRCTFVDNHVLGNFENSTGGAVATDKAMLIDCHFEANRARSHGPAQGGALAVTDESSQVINCSFFNNDVISCCAPAEGGAMSGPGTLLSCLFVGNNAEDNGGGYFGTGSVLNCTFVANEAGIGAAIDGHALVSNTIAWNNIGNQINGAEVTYSNIQGGYDGEGNISGTPRFVDPKNGDYRLELDSPCIDAGDTMQVEECAVDLDGHHRRFDDPDTKDTGLGRAPIVDMGAYEFGSAGTDCNGNAILDECDIADGTSEDCNGNGVPDECDDCNGNGILDDEDIANGTSEDCNGNAIPDECDIANGVSDDCNGNGVPDDCDIADGASPDCDENGIPDECELQDCNGNGVLDSCDIADGVSFDCDQDGFPDECDGVIGDLSDDGVVDTTDLLLLLGNWGACADCADCYADIDCDCTVGTGDLLILLGNWG